MSACFSGNEFKLAGMNKRTGFLLVVLMSLTLFIAWSATEPNQFLMRPGTEPAPQPYPWTYPAWMLFFGSVVIGLSSFKKPLARFVGAAISFLFGAFLVVILGMTVMHSPPVHDNLLYVLFFSSLGLLFFSGYACAIWRSKSHDKDSAS
jgi:hypothetical protein